MKLSVVIPTYNRRGVLAHTLPTVLEQDFPADQYEVVVVVDGSTDTTVEFLRGLKAPCALRILEQSNRGPAAARNAGIAAARSELVLLLDDDIRCEPTLVRRHVAAHDGAEPSVVFGLVLIAQESTPGLATDLVRDWYGNHAERISRHGGPESVYDVWVYSNCSAPRALLLAHGGYDESYRWAMFEDTDFAFRLWNAGVRFRLEPDATVHQVYSKSSEHLIASDAPRLSVGEIHLCRKQPGFRPYARLSGMIDGSRVRSLLARLSCAAPFSPQPLVKVPFTIAERFRYIPAVRRAGLGLLNYRTGVEALRGAIRETGSWQALRQEFGIGLPVLAYRRVGPHGGGSDPEMTVSPDQFDRQVRWLAERRYTGIRPCDWLAWCREGKPLPQRPILLTFDGAYADLADFALPVLHRHGFGAGVFVLTGQIEGHNGQVRKPAGIPPLMNAAQIQHWAAQGIEFGSYSRTHPDLTALGDDQLAEEVDGSQNDLARILGSRPASFAYPYGRHDSRVRKCVARRFDMAFTTEEGLNGLPTDPYQLRRTVVRPKGNLLDFGCRVRFGWAPAMRLRRRLRFSGASAEAERVV